MEDDNARTDSTGLLNSAESLLAVGSRARKDKRKTRPRAQSGSLPIHPAIELYLALLRRHYGVDKLAKKFGHSRREMANERRHSACCDRRGPRSAQADGADEDVIESRYIRTGPKTWPSFETLNRTCKSFRESVGKILREGGVMVLLG
jgi:hypothetical protein